MQGILGHACNLRSFLFYIYVFIRKCPFSLSLYLCKFWQFNSNNKQCNMKPSANAIVGFISILVFFGVFFSLFCFFFLVFGISINNWKLSVGMHTPLHLNGQCGRTIKAIAKATIYCSLRVAHTPHVPSPLPPMSVGNECKARKEKKRTAATLINIEAVFEANKSFHNQFCCWHVALRSARPPPPACVCV